MGLQNSAKQHVSTTVLIVGGGFSGIGVAVRLLERGVRDFVVLEKSLARQHFPGVRV